VFDWLADAVFGIWLLVCVAAFVWGGGWLLALAFRTDVLWALACLIPFVVFGFVWFKWPETKKPFFLFLGGFLGLALFEVLDVLI